MARLFPISFIPTFGMASILLGSSLLSTSGIAAEPRLQTVAVAARPAQAAQLPAQEAMVILIRSSLVALGQANVTNNYSVLNALGSENFRRANPSPRLATVFESFRTNNIDLSPVVYLQPQLTAAPTLEKGRLRLVGVVPSKPMQVNFDLTFEPDRGTWKLFGLGVNLTAAPAR